jgi:hypothetical protein
VQAFVQTRLTFDRHWLTIRQELFGCGYRQKRIPLYSIAQILAGDDLDRIHKLILTGSGCASNKQYQTILAKLSDRLVFQVGGQIYSTNSLSLADRVWLRNEIQHWLRQNQG